MNKLEANADSAEMIINGYAFIKAGNNVKVINLNNPNKALLMDNTGDVLETSMDDIEISIVQAYWEKNKQFAED